jgi:16S rRNA (guanine966-N2)-methyltransferase
MTDKFQKPIAPRIIGGKRKGLKLYVADHIRPITDRMKQSLFDHLGDKVVGTMVLDIYAGSGSLGLESLSRGADHVTFVETDPHTLDKNIKKMDVANQTKVFAQPFDKFIRNHRMKYDLIFVDPPYEDVEQLELHKFGKLMNEEAILVFKLPKPYMLPNLVTMPIVHEKLFGNNKIIIVGKSNPT